MKIKIFTSVLLLVVFIITPTQAAKRPTEKAAKEFELYSWRNSDGVWSFALFPGTNQRKTKQEIKKKENRISSISELAKRFSSLPEGENVYWFNRDVAGFEFPDDSMITEIKLSAKTAKIKLHLPPNISRKS